MFGEAPLIKDAHKWVTLKRSGKDSYSHKCSDCGLHAHLKEDGYHGLDFGGYGSTNCNERQSHYALMDVMDKDLESWGHLLIQQLDDMRYKNVQPDDSMLDIMREIAWRLNRKAFPFKILVETPNFLVNKKRRYLMCA